MSGAQAIAYTEDMRVKINTLYLMNKGDVLTYDYVNSGARIYMAIAGGYERQEGLDSASTETSSQWGGFEGHLPKNEKKIPKKRN
ncbi:hypothetical protein [Staphylococcus chromogenes]